MELTILARLAVQPDTRILMPLFPDVGITGMGCRTQLYVGTGAQTQGPMVTFYGLSHFSVFTHPILVTRRRGRFS